MNGTDRQWPMLVLLSVIVLLSSATVLWLVNVAVRNERVAIRQQLVDTYRQQLEFAAAQVDAHWLDVERQCTELAKDATPSELFARCVNSKVADSLLIMGPGGSIRYPTEPTARHLTVSTSLNADAWTAASQLEFSGRKYQIAAEAYGAIAEVEFNTGAVANARLAQARCLCKCNRHPEAIALLTQTFDAGEMQAAADEDGRSWWVIAQLRLLELTGDANEWKVSGTSANIFDDRVRRLREALSDYRRPMLASQRVFAMHEIQSMSPDSPPFTTLVAEEFAAEVRSDIGPELVTDTWNLHRDERCLPLRKTPVVLLFQTAGVTARTDELLRSWQSDKYSIELVVDDLSTANKDTIAKATLDTLPLHRLVLTLNDPELLDSTLRAQTSMYIIGGILTIASVSVIAILVGFVVRQQLRLAAMKNDLVAVVAHELRTPLASSRVLVDTLLDRDDGDQQQREYLQLIAGENERLTRLVDNFLSFSRLEKRDASFPFEEVASRDIVDRAVAAMQNRMVKSERSFVVNVADDLPKLNANADALVTILMNLLENAIKFSSDDDEIALRVEQCAGEVHFEVRDDGIGMSARDVRRAFDKFYQADARLSRSHDGCGLGLSLVKSIVDAHGGNIEVESKLDVGSVFRVRLPIVASPSSEQREDHG